MSSPGLSAPEGSIARTIIDRAMRRGRLAHSIMLHGRSFSDLEKLAMELGRLILELPDETSDQHLLDHPDFLQLRPTGKARQIQIGKNSQIKGTLRQFNELIAKSPYAGGRKIAIVYEADRLNASSSNAFLKTLEEPPGDTTILLLTTRPYALLPTIRSRCLHLRVPEEPATALDAGISNWLSNYRTWLDKLVDEQPARDKVPELILGLYALVSDFKDHLARLTKEASSKENAPETEFLTDDEESALEARLTVSIRDDLLARIEEATSVFARDLAQQGRETLAGRLPAAIEALEEMTGLLRVNYQVQNVLEQFLLLSLRIWSAPE